MAGFDFSPFLEPVDNTSAPAAVQVAPEAPVAVAKPEINVIKKSVEKTFTFDFSDYLEAVTDVLTAPTQAPDPVSEDSDRQFFQSGVGMEDRVFEPEAEGYVEPVLPKAIVTPQSNTQLNTGLGERNLSPEEQTSLSSVGEITLAQAVSITDANDTFSNAALNTAIDSSVKNSTRQGILKGAIEVETGGDAPDTEDNTYSIKAAKAVFTGVDAIVAGLPLDVRTRLQYDFDNNRLRGFRTASEADMQMLGNALFDEKYEGGSNFRGRGLIQLTGQSNYQAVQDILQGQGIDVDLIANPDLVNDSQYALPVAIAFLEHAGLDDTSAENMSAKGLNNKINSGANSTIARERWEEVISALRTSGMTAKADELELRNEYAAQVEVSASVDGDIGTGTKGLIDTWATSDGRSLITPAVTPITKIRNSDGVSYQTYSEADKLKLTVFVNGNK